MKAFTNKTAYGILTVLLALSACGPSSPAVPVEEELDVQLVEEITPDAPLPPATKTVPEPAAVSPSINVAKQNAAPQPAQPVSSASKAQPNDASAARTYRVEELTAQLKKWEENLNTFSTDFQQVSSYDGVEINRSAGRLLYDFTRNLLRWEMLDQTGALTQAAISNKKEIIILDDALQPVTTLSWQEWQKGQPNQALFDVGNYAQLVSTHRVEIKAQDAQKAVLAFTPMQAGENYTLLITLSKKDFVPLEIAVEAEGMTTVNRLLAVRKNEPLPADLFGGFFK